MSVCCTMFYYFDTQSPQILHCSNSKHNAYNNLNSAVLGANLCCELIPQYRNFIPLISNNTEFNCINFNLLNFLKGFVHLPFLEMSIISFDHSYLEYKKLVWMDL